MMRSEKTVRTAERELFAPVAPYGAGRIMGGGGLTYSHYRKDRSTAVVAGAADDLGREPSYTARFRGPA
jgi:hypothetical protein